MAHPGIIKNQGRDFNFYNKITVSWPQFGASDGYTLADGYGPDLIITFPTQQVNFSLESTGVVQYSFNGTTVHGELDSTKNSANLFFPNRVISLIWFKLISGSGVVRVEAWGIR